MIVYTYRNENETKEITVNLTNNGAVIEVNNKVSKDFASIELTKNEMKDLVDTLKKVF